MSEQPPEPPDVLSLFFTRAPSRRGRVVPFHALPQGQQEQQISAYQAARPGTSRQQARQRISRMRRRGRITGTVRPERATEQQQKQASTFQRRSEAATRPRHVPATDYDPQFTAQIVYDKIVISMREQISGQTFVMPDGSTYTTDLSTQSPMEFGISMDVITFNMTNASPAERVWAVDTASGSSIRHLATDANRRGITSPWFYHQDLYQGL